MGAPMGAASADRSMETLMVVASVDPRWEAEKAVAGPPCMAIPMEEALVVDLVAVWPLRASTRQRELLAVAKPRVISYLALEYRALAW